MSERFYVIKVGKEYFVPSYSSELSLDPVISFVPDFDNAALWEAAHSAKFWCLWLSRQGFSCEILNHNHKVIARFK